MIEKASTKGSVQNGWSSDIDVAVIGAAPAGTVAALTAARAGARVLLLNESSDHKIDVGRPFRL